MELFQKIEALTGQTMEQHSAQEEEVMLLAERVSEAGRIAHMQVRHPAGCHPMLSSRGFTAADRLLPFADEGGREGQGRKAHRQGQSGRRW